MTIDREREVAALAKADADLVLGEQRIAEQRLRIERLRRDGQDLDQAEEMLRAFQASLQEWQTHRASIVQLIRQIDAGLV